MREISPCKGCSERFTACSDCCPKDDRGEFGYKAWLERYHAQQKHLAAGKSRWIASPTVDSERRSRRDKKFGSGGHKYGGTQ